MFSGLDQLTDQRRAHIMIGKNGAIIAFSGFVQLDPEIGDRCRAQLFSYPPFHIPCGLADLQQAFMGLIRDGIRIDAWTRFRLWGEDVVDGGLMHRLQRQGPSLELERLYIPVLPM